MSGGHELSQGPKVFPLAKQDGTIGQGQHLIKIGAPGVAPLNTDLALPHWVPSP